MDQLFAYLASVQNEFELENKLKYACFYDFSLRISLMRKERVNPRNFEYAQTIVH